MQEYTLPFGPQHPALVEPAHLKLNVDGETIVGAKITKGMRVRDSSTIILLVSRSDDSTAAPWSLVKTKIVLSKYGLSSTAFMNLPSA